MGSQLQEFCRITAELLNPGIKTLIYATNPKGSSISGGGDMQSFSKVGSIERSSIWIVIMAK